MINRALVLGHGIQAQPFIDEQMIVPVLFIKGRKSLLAFRTVILSQQ